MSRLPLVDGALDLDQHRVLRGGQEIVLSPQEVALLARLVARPGEAVAREVLLVEVLGARADTGTRAVDHAMRRLRLKVEADPARPAHIESVRGLGYRWRPAPEGSALVGRDEALRALELRLGTPLLTLLGPAGVGKTALARALLRRRGGLLVELGPCATLDDARVALAEALGIGPSAPDLDGSIAEALGARPAGVLVLDEAEALAEALAPSLRRWSGALPAGGTLLVTSRVPVEGPTLPLAPLDPAGADALLRARLPEGALGDPEDLPALLATLDGLPLAIELAAAWLDLLPAADLARRVTEGLDLPARRTGAPPRHSSLDAAMAASFALLSEHARRALGRLSHLVGPFDLSAAEALIDGPALPTLAQLQGLALLTPRGPGRWALLDTVRRYAASRRGDDAEGELRHARHHLARLQALAGDPEGLRPLVPELRAAFTRCLTRDPTLALELYVSQHGYDWSHATPEGALSRCRALQRACTSAPPRQRARLLWSEGQWCSRTGSLDAAERALARATDLAREAGAQRELAGVLRTRSLYALYRGDPGPVAAFLDEGLAAARAAGAEREEMNLLYAACELRLRRGQPVEARPHILEAEALARAVGQPCHVADMLRQRGMLEVELGWLDQAEALLDEALALDGLPAYGGLLTRLCQAELALARGALDEARAIVGEVEPPARRADIMCRSWLDEALGLLAALEGDPVRARDRLLAAREGFLRLGQRPLAARTLAAAAAMSALAGDAAEARRARGLLEASGDLSAFGAWERLGWEAAAGVTPAPALPRPGEPGPNTRARVALALASARPRHAPPGVRSTDEGVSGA